MKKFIKNLSEISYQFLMVSWHRITALRASYAGGDSSGEISGSSASKGSVANGLAIKAGLAALVVALIGVAGWKLSSGQKDAAEPKVAWLSEYRSVLASLDKGESGPKLVRSDHVSASTASLIVRLNAHLGGLESFNKSLVYPRSLVSYLPAEVVTSLSDEEKGEYVNALFREWQGYLFSADVISASAHRKELEEHLDIRKLSPQQQLQAAYLGLRTDLVGGAPLPQDRLSRIEKSLDGSAVPSSNAYFYLLRASLIEAYARQGQTLSAIKLLDRTMERLKAAPATTEASGADSRRSVADAAMIVGRFADGRVALQAFRNVQEAPSSCHAGLEYWLTQAELSLHEGSIEQVQFSLSEVDRCLNLKQAGKHFQFARMKNVEGLLLLLLEQPSRALDAFEREEAIWRNVLGDEHFWIGHALNNQGVALRMEGNLSQARDEFEKASSLWRNVLGEKHPMIATYHNNLAELEMMRGNLGQAKDALIKAHKIRIEAYGEEHPLTALVVGNLGELESLLGNYEESESLHKKALSIRLRVWGPKHPEVALSMNNLGAVLFKSGEFDRAQGYLMQALEISQEQLGEKHPRTHAVLANLASVHVALENYAAAESSLVKLSEIESLKGPDALPSLATVLVRLGDVRLRLGLHREAGECYLGALKALDQVDSGVRSPDLIRDALTGVSSVNRKLGKVEAVPKPESLFPWLKSAK
jgi:tetratricopeptide (TPR) repeat protein